MLVEFTDIIMDELPPKRNISHHINFMPGVSLPTKEAYRMKPQENAEIENQM